MNKSTNFCANKTQIPNRLTEIGIYNQSVKENLQKNNLNPLLLRAIEIFHEQRKKEKTTTEQYNSLVAEFNKRNGLVLLKKGTEFSSVINAGSKKYNYINYPYLTSEACLKTMDNYRDFRHKYNKEAHLQNKEIRDYNNSVVKMYTSLTKEEKKIVKQFEEENNSLFVKDYNELVVEMNSTNPIYRKKRIQTIKLVTETFFWTLLGFYVKQLKEYNGYLMEMNRSTRVLKNALPKIKIDQRKLSNHKRNNIPKLGVCKKTAQNHVKRLMESGLLIGYTYINQNKPISVNFNPEILHILDGNPPKRKNPEKESLNSPNGNVLPVNKEITRTKLKEKERMDFAKGKGLRKCGSMLEGIVSNREFYKNTKGMKIKNIPGPPKNEILAKNFNARLLNDNDFAEKLSNGDFVDYKGLRYDYLQKIIQYAHISTEDFRDILIQDLIKSSSKIWKNHTVHVGEWKRTINTLKTQFFKYHPNKEVVFKRLFEYRWKLEWARKWFIKHTEVNALFPYDYFDTTRTTKQEIGFFGLHKNWLKHKDYLKKKMLESKNQVQKAAVRKRKLTAQKKLTTAIKKYESGVYNYKQLYNYVQDNLPHDYLVSLPNLFKNQNTNLA